MSRPMLTVEQVDAARKVLGSILGGIGGNLVYVHPAVLRAHGIDPKPFCNADGVAVIPTSDHPTVERKLPWTLK